MLAVIETHPIQYHAPVYRLVQQRFGVPVTAIYGSDFSVAGYRDAEFGATFAWDSDLLSGHSPVFLSRVADGGAPSVDGVSARGLGGALRATEPKAVLLTGYSPRFHQVAFYQAWRTGAPPESGYHLPYWERLQKLDYPFLKGDLATSVGLALRFTLSVPGVHTAIVGTTQPGRWRQNAELIAAGPLSVAEFQAIRHRWQEVADPDWTGRG